MIRLPNELWADVFKWLNRQELVRQVQPVCRRFHFIAEQHVDNLHIILYFERFVYNLANNESGAIEQLEHLSANESNLAKHFRLYDAVYLDMICLHEKADNKYRQALECVVRNSLELFRGCKLILNVTKYADDFYSPGGVRRKFDWQLDDLVANLLALLQHIEPFSIQIYLTYQYESLSSSLDQVVYRQPAVLGCPHLTFLLASIGGPSSETIFQWLHHLPMHVHQRNKTLRMDTSLSEQIEQLTNQCAETIERCTLIFQQAQMPEKDRRAFLFIFTIPGWVSDRFPEFCLENFRTGEQLRLRQSPQIYESDEQVLDVIKSINCPNHLISCVENGARGSATLPAGECE